MFIVPKPERGPPVIPTDYKWAQELRPIRTSDVFISTISDERGQELLYADMRISDRRWWCCQFAIVQDVGGFSFISSFL